MPWVAPTEPDSLKSLPGMLVTLLPERYGCDVLWRVKGGFAGIQRKELSDLLSSVSDGRLAKEVQQMQELVFRWLVVEGKPSWTMDGAMMTSYGRPWTLTQYTNLLRSVSVKGITVEFSNDLTSTAEMIQSIISWTKEPHTSLSKRPGPTVSWGKADNRDYQLHLIQGLPGVGYELAERILDTLGMPFGLRVSREDLLSVPGIGRKKADSILAAVQAL